MKPIVVKPVRANDQTTQWIVVEMSAWQDLKDDLHRYGWRVFLYNLAVYLYNGWL